MPARSLILSAVLLASCLLQLPSAAYFFQGDSLYWLGHRYQNWSEVGQALISLDLHGWYRPLSHRLIPSLFFPIFGLDAAPYHLPVYGLFLIICLLAHRLFDRLAPNPAAALLATSYFALHSYQVFVTFDFFSEPDLLYCLFGLLAVLGFLEWRRKCGSVARITSALCFTLALLSKEPAVMIPLILTWLYFLETGRGALARLRSSGLGIPFGLLAGYLLFVFGVLRRGTLDSGTLSLSTSLASVLDNFLRLSAWSFNLPWSWHSQTRQLPAAGWTVLLLIALLAVAGWLAILFRKSPRRVPLAAGLGWFLISAAPLLLLLELKPYYLLFPLIGFSLAWGVGLDYWGRIVSSPRLALGLQVLVLAIVTITSALLGGQDRTRHPLLGGSARLNQQARQDLLGSRPELPADAHLLILDRPGDSALWSFAGGELFRLIYRNPRLPVSFASLGFAWPDPSIASDSLFVFQLENGHLVDVSQRFRNDASEFLPSESSFRYGPTEAGLIRIEPQRVEVGRGSYRLTVNGLSDLDVELQFRLEDGPIGVVRADLDAAGGVTYFVSEQTPRGRYTFFAVRRPGAAIWRRSSPAVVQVE